MRKQKTVPAERNGASSAIAATQPFGWMAVNDRIHSIKDLQASAETFLALVDAHRRRHRGNKDMWSDKNDFLITSLLNDFLSRLTNQEDLVVLPCQIKATKSGRFSDASYCNWLSEYEKHFAQDHQEATDGRRLFQMVFVRVKGSNGVKAQFKAYVRVRRNRFPKQTLLDAPPYFADCRQSADTIGSRQTAPGDVVVLSVDNSEFAHQSPRAEISQNHWLARAKEEILADEPPGRPDEAQKLNCASNQEADSLPPNVDAGTDAQPRDTGTAEMADQNVKSKRRSAASPDLPPSGLDPRFRHLRRLVPRRRVLDRKSTNWTRLEKVGAVAFAVVTAVASSFVGLTAGQLSAGRSSDSNNSALDDLGREISRTVVWLRQPPPPPMPKT